MTLRPGAILPYGPFRTDLQARAPQATGWSWMDVSSNLKAHRNAEQPGLALLALSRTPALAGCETVPGLSLSVQALDPGTTTPTHAHAWWHIFVVQTGSGEITCGDSAPQRLTTNDIVFVPAWCRHALRNDGSGPFTTLNVSNMAQQADLANFKAD